MLPVFSHPEYPLRDDDSLTNRGMMGEHILDFAQLDPKAADLHLLIDPAEKLQVPLRQPPALVARAIEPGAGLFAEGIGQESLRGQIRATQVAAGQTDSAQVQLARHPDRCGSKALIEHEGRGIGNGLADARLAPSALQRA